MNNKSNFYIFIAVCLIAFGYFLYPQFNETEIKIEHGPITIEKTKSDYKPLPPVFFFSNNSVLVQKLVDTNNNTYTVLKDSSIHQTDSLNSRIVHTTVIDPSGITAKTYWEEVYQIFRQVDSIYITQRVNVIEEVPIPWYKDNWFYSTLALIALLISNWIK